MAARRSGMDGATFAAAVLIAVLPRLLESQAPVLEPEPPSTYLAGYSEVMKLGSAVSQAADVDNLVLTRDAGELTLERGKLYLLPPVLGRTVGAVFQGQGRFRFTPTLAVERQELARFAGAPSLDEAFTEAVLLFADSTAHQLGALNFRPVGAALGGLEHVRDLLHSLEEEEGTLRSDVIGPLLNGKPTGFFLARLERTRGGPLLFEINAEEVEAVQLWRPVRHREWGANWAVVTKGQLLHTPGSARSWELRPRLTVSSYRMDVSITPTYSADLDVAASATLALRANEPIGPWVRFVLHPETEVDSVRWGAGEPAAVFKGKDSEDVWVRAARRFEAGDTIALTLYYRGGHGGLIDRVGDWFFIRPGAAWYPMNGQGDDFADFDVTFHAPSWYPLASIGERTDSTVSGKVLTTRWVTRRPTQFSTFNLGLFESYHTHLPGAPPLDVLISENAHRALERFLLAEGYPIPAQAHMRENVAADVANSMKLFTHLFGECFYDHFYVTEIPFAEGVSFPGMIDLSFITFRNTESGGSDESFRAHEVAHQWWGNGVHQSSYRDKWLTEGLAEFSGLWYLQSQRKRNDDYFKFLDQYQTDINDIDEDTGPIWIGDRTKDPKVPRTYAIMVYEKGAWVFHMLRILMLDLRTKSEDRFTAMMRDYYMSYRGKPATTEDFQRVVEQHVGMPMDWFFDQWVKGTGIPTYRVSWNNRAASDGKYAVRLRVSQQNVPPDFRMPVLVSVDLGEQRFAHFRIDVRGTQTEYTSPLLPGPAKVVKFNELHSVLADVKME